MSRVESPFHAIAAEALDDNDIPDVKVPDEVEADGSSAPATTTTDGQQEDSAVKPPVLESNTENGGEHFRGENGGQYENGVEDNEASGKNGGPEQEAEETPVALEHKVFSEEASTKKSKKRTNVWTKTTSRKSAKKVKNSGVRGQSDAKDDNVLLKPFHQEDDPSYPILLSKVYKAEKIELSADRLTASGSKGYRMVRATRGVVEGAWYFEVCVERLGDTGHTRLGWSTRRGDIQAPVGYDAHSYSLRDLDGCKVHAALREDHGEAYHEEDVIGFYINLPREPGFMRKSEEEVVAYKGQPYIIVADEPLKPLPGSEILFFKNGVCQGLAFKDINDGSYFPAASMYTLPSQDCCKVVFNFGPDFRYPITDFGDRPLPSPMCQAPRPSGEARAETFPTNQTEAVVQITDSGGDKWMAPELGDPMEVEEAAEAIKKEGKPKEVEKVAPVVQRKMKKSKVPVGNHNPSPSSKGAKVGRLLLHPESKKNANFKSFKNDIVRVGVESIGLLSQKGDKKDTAKTRFPNPKETRKSKGLLDLKGIPKETGLSIHNETQKGKGLLNLKGVQKDKGSPSLKVTKKSSIGTGAGTVVALKAVKKNLPPTDLALQASKKDSHGTGLALKSSKDSPRIGLVHKPSKKVLPGTGSAHKSSKKDFPGVGSAHKPGKKDLPGTGSAHKPSKRDLAGTGLVHKPSEFNRPGSLPKGMGPSAFSADRNWGDIHGALNVDVFVVKTSTPTQVEGPFR